MPPALQKGINLSYIWGENNWRMTYPASGVPMFSNPYPAERLKNTLEPADFARLRNLGFGHIRLTIDPWALGLLEEPLPGVAPMYAVPANSPIMEYLIQVIEMAWEEGLWTIVDFHPSTLAPGNWKRALNAALTIPNTPPPYQWDTTLVDAQKYRGTYKYHFLEPAPTTPSNAMAPLEIFWQSMDPYFANLKHPVVFELCNEPFDGAYEGYSDEFDESMLSTTIFGLDGANGFNHTIGGVPQWINPKESQWRDTTKRCIKQIEGKNRYIIVSNPKTDAVYYDPGGMAPFTGSDGIDWPQNIIYAAHFYTPFVFTHRLDGLAGSGTGYVRLRDFYPMPGVPSAYADATAWDRMLKVSNWIGQARTTLDPLGLPLHVMFTEFGTTRPDRTAVYGGVGWGGHWGSTTAPANFWIAGYPTTIHQDTSRYIYDTRKAIESMQAGWTSYAAHQTFGLFNGEVDGATWGQHGDWGPTYAETEHALFEP